LACVFFLFLANGNTNAYIQLSIEVQDGEPHVVFQECGIDQLIKCKYKKKIQILYITLSLHLM